MSDVRTVKSLPKNDQPYEHSGPNGTQFNGDRCDLSDGVKVLRPSYISDAQFAMDVADFASWHTHWIYPELNGFQGWGAIQFIITTADEDSIN